MGYDALEQQELHDRFDEDSPPATRSPSPDEPLASAFAPLKLFLDEQNTRSGGHGNANVHENTPSTAFTHLFGSIASGTTKSSYDMVDDDDYEESNSPALSTDPGHHQNHNHNHNHKHREVSPPSTSTSTSPFVPIAIPKPRAIRPRILSHATSFHDIAGQDPRTLPRSVLADPILRTASGRSIALRHPTPDLQVLQGAYVSNIEQLERSAEKLSMTSSIDDAIREMHQEQKRNDSRRSSLLSSPDLPFAIQRQPSNASSIVETNTLARSGGYSPAAFMMSPKGSMSTNGRNRSGSGVSKTSRYGTRPEPEQEGRPLDSFVSIPAVPPIPRAESIAEQDEETNTFTRPVVNLLGHQILEEPLQNKGQEYERPSSPSASINTFEVQQAFADFDGVHSQLPPLPSDEFDDDLEFPQRRTVSGESTAGIGLNYQENVPSHEYQTMARPQSYMDPLNGQQMVYYPAPVPMMLNLPQKLSKMPSSMARNKRRSQVLSSIPPKARQSAIWLPDVLETEDEPDLREDDGAQQMEYVAQHQRSTMGGRRLTQDIQHMPEQLRATVFFELPGASEVVELKEQSAVATLDSILDASAHAPVNAFTDHAFAGHLGAEVYGKPAARRSQNIRHSKSSTHLLADEKAQKRASSFSNLLHIGKRASSSNVSTTEEEKRRNTIADVRQGKIIRDEDDEDDEDGRADAAALEGSDNEAEYYDEEEAEQLYTGAPTTLLAELQLRKQQQKERMRPLASSYPNGLHSTLLEMDAVANVEQKKRRTKRVNLAWEDPALEEPDVEDDDEDVPLAMLYSKKTRIQEPDRPLGLMERREIEDNEPLSRRRDRLQGKSQMVRAAPTMVALARQPQSEEDGETLALRVQRLKDESTAVDDGIPLPKARPVSGDFASEMMSQFGGDKLQSEKGKEVSTSPAPEEEETLGQRRNRLQAEKLAREKELEEEAERPPLNTRHSMATILQAHPAAGANRVPSYDKAATGLLGMQEQENSRRAGTMLDKTVSASKQAAYNNPSPRQAPLPYQQQRVPSHNNLAMKPQLRPQQPLQQQRTSSYNAYAMPPQQARAPSYNVYNNGAIFPQPSLAYANPAPMMGYANPNPQLMQPGMPMNYAMPNMHMPMQNPMMMMGSEPLNPGQVDMVERWRQSVMH